MKYYILKSIILHGLKLDIKFNKMQMQNLLLTCAPENIERKR